MSQHEYKCCHIAADGTECPKAAIVWILESATTHPSEQTYMCADHMSEHMPEGCVCGGIQEAMPSARYVPGGSR